MNFGNADTGHQRPIEGRDTLDQKIQASRSPYARETTSNRSSSSSSPTPDDGTIRVVHDADVLCGRGKTSFNHGTYCIAKSACSLRNWMLMVVIVCLPTAGNKRFRDLITMSIPDYDMAETRLEKSLVVHSIVEGIRSAGGRFLKVDQAPGRWLGRFEKHLCWFGCVFRSVLLGASQLSIYVSCCWCRIG
jgi:hypothetical protein